MYPHLVVNTPPRDGTPSSTMLSGGKTPPNTKTMVVSPTFAQSPEFTGLAVRHHLPVRHGIQREGTWQS